MKRPPVPSAPVAVAASVADPPKGSTRSTVASVAPAPEAGAPQSSANRTPPLTAGERVRRRPVRPGSAIQSPVRSGIDFEDPAPPQKLNPDLQKALQEELGALDSRQILFRCPPEMTLGVTERVGVQTVENLTELVRQGLAQRGVAPEHLALVSAYVRASVQGGVNSPFEISATARSTRAAGEWLVTPLRSGEQRLDLHASISASIHGLAQEEKYLPVFSQVIQIRPNPLYSMQKFLRTNWEWIGAGLLVSLALWGWSQWPRKPRISAHRGSSP